MFTWTNQVWVKGWKWKQINWSNHVEKEVDKTVEVEKVWWVWHQVRLWIAHLHRPVHLHTRDWNSMAEHPDLTLVGTAMEEEN